MHIVYRNSEETLLRALTGIKDKAQGYYGLHFHSSKLESHHRSDFQIRIASNILSDIFKDAKGGIFVCNDSDILALVKGEERNSLNDAINQVRHLFSDDPLALTKDGQDNKAFCTTSLISYDWKAFFDICKAKAELKHKHKKQEEEKKDDGTIQPLTLPHLIKIEKDLSVVELAHMLRNQKACAFPKGSKDVQPIFDEVYVNMAHLKQLLPENVNLFSNPTLFKYLTELLDVQVMKQVIKQGSFYTRGSLSLNLNISTVLSPHFTTFDTEIKQLPKPPAIIVELHVGDVFSDIGRFLEARHRLNQLGYKLCLDGVNNQSLLHVNRGKLGFDLIKLQWNAELKGSMRKQEFQQVHRAIKECGENRTILCRCDCIYAIQYGQAMGISLFQGRYLDKRLNPNARVVN